MDKSVRIMAIAPYESLVGDLARAAESFPGVYVDIFQGDLAEGAAIAREKQADGYDAIISRGGTARMISEVTELPVIPIQLSVYDVLRAIRLASNYTSRYAVVGFSEITESAHTLCDLLGYQVEIITVSSAEEAGRAVATLQEEGVKMIVGDMVTRTIARQAGLDAILITSGAESLNAAIDLAVKRARRYSATRGEITLLRAALDVGDGFMVVKGPGGKTELSVPAEIDREMEEALRSATVTAPRGATSRFYHWGRDRLYRIEAFKTEIGGREFTIYRCRRDEVPLKAARAGIRIYSAAECRELFNSSFFALSGALGDLDQKVNALARGRQCVLIEGEPGSGKSQIAKAIHLRGEDSRNPFVLVDCPALDNRSWSFLISHNASPLNEVGLTIHFQDVDALGEQRALELASVVLETDVSRRCHIILTGISKAGGAPGQVAAKLGGRIGCSTLRLPPLRERAGEIASLATLYTDFLAERQGLRISGFTPRALELLGSYPWPRNHTQFKQVLQELVFSSTSPYIKGEAVAEALDRQGAASAPAGSFQGISGMTLEEMTLMAARQALEENQGNHTAAARQLGIGRSTLWRILKRS